MNTRIWIVSCSDCSYLYAFRTWAEARKQCLVGHKVRIKLVYLPIKWV